VVGEKHRRDKRSWPSIVGYIRTAFSRKERKVEKFWGEEEEESKRSAK